MNNSPFWALFITEKCPLPFILRLGLGLNILPLGLLYSGLLGHVTYTTMSTWMEAYNMDPALVTLVYAGLLVGPVLLITGFLTRVGAFLLGASTVTQVIYLGLAEKLFMNWNGAPPPNHEGLEYHLLTFLICLVLLIKGGGMYSVDGSFTAEQSHY